ncbi:MAG TPA: hypothetical protein VEB22_03955 [Phycisphaerales bacterium]|nr:hypothetical protein [Phycisphaerales bacterium]
MPESVQIVLIVVLALAVLASVIAVGIVALRATDAKAQSESETRQTLLDLVSSGHARIMMAAEPDTAQRELDRIALVARGERGLASPREPETPGRDPEDPPHGSTFVATPNGFMGRPPTRAPDLIEELDRDPDGP